MLRYMLTAGLALALSFPALVRADDASKAPDKRLEGKWESVSVVDNGVKNKRAYATIVFENDRATVTEGDDGDAYTGKCRIKADLKSSPKAIDFMCDDDPFGEETVYAIYDVKDDVLLLCTSDTRERPKEFQSRPLSGVCIITFKRVKK